MSLKKLERLSWVEKTFGADCVMPYRSCRDWSEIEHAIRWHEGVPRTWGIRTDTVNGHRQGFGLPFVFHGSRLAAQEIWGFHGNRLVYIVSQNLPKVRVHSVALRIDKEHIFVEWNDQEEASSQREMYDHPENLRRAVFGPHNFVPWNGVVWRSFRPRDGAQFRFEKVYATMMSHGLDEVTFSVARDGRLVVW